MRGTVSRPTLVRLPMYYRTLEGLRQRGVDRVSSRELAGCMGITASQLRQDLSAFGHFGQQGYGYRVDDLLEAVAQVLGLNRRHDMVLVGAGRIGSALVHYENFRRRGFRFLRIFDLRSNLVGTKMAGIPVAHVEELPDFLRREPVEIGVITTPPEVAQQMADILVRGGVRGIWNFAPVHLQVPPGVVMEHMHISDSLFILTLRLQSEQ